MLDADIGRWLSNRAIYQIWSGDLDCYAVINSLAPGRF